MAVALVQALCPDRHCILALASDELSADEARDRLKAFITVALAFGEINPWCGLCGASAETWHYEVGPSRFASMEAARAALHAAEADQLESARLLRAAGLAYDTPPGAQN